MVTSVSIWLSFSSNSRILHIVLLCCFSDRHVVCCTQTKCPDGSPFNEFSLSYALIPLGVMRPKFQEKKGQEIWGWERWKAAVFAGYRVTVINRHDPSTKNLKKYPSRPLLPPPGFFSLVDSQPPFPLFPMSYGKKISAGLLSLNLSPQQRISKSNHPKAWAP